MSNSTSILAAEATALLKELISTPSFSKEEGKTAAILNRFIGKKGIEPKQVANNVFAQNKHVDKSNPTLLLNPHHDTVRPNAKYTQDPFSPITEDGKLYGLGSNDAGGSLVALLSTFLYFYERGDLKHNLV